MIETCEANSTLVTTCISLFLLLIASAIISLHWKNEVNMLREKYESNN